MSFRLALNSPCSQTGICHSLRSLNCQCCESKYFYHIWDILTETWHQVGLYPLAFLSPRHKPCIFDAHKLKWLMIKWWSCTWHRIETSDKNIAKNNNNLPLFVYLEFTPQFYQSIILFELKFGSVNFILLVSFALYKMSLNYYYSSSQLWFCFVLFEFNEKG